MGFVDKGLSLTKRVKCGVVTESERGRTSSHFSSLPERLSPL